MLVCGIDGGNNTVITAIEGMEPIIIPTIIAPYTDFNNGLELKDKPLLSSLDVEIELNYNNQRTKRNLGRFFVGERIKSLGITPDMRDIGDIKEGDEKLLVVMLTSLAVAAVMDQDKKSGIVRQDLKIVTGLPYLQVKIHKDAYKQEFIGQHKVTIRGKDTIEVELNILDVTVDVEGAGALNKLIFNGDDYIYEDSKIVDRIVLGVEVGEFTTEIIALKFKENEEGNIIPEYHIPLCTGMDKGIANAKQKVIDYLRENHATEKDRYDIDHVVKRKNNRGVISLANGEAFDIIPLYKQSLGVLAAEVTSMIKNKIKNTNDTGNIIHTLLYGGGPCVLEYQFGNALREKMKAEIGGESTISEKPHLANALGYLEKAKYIYGEE